MNSDLKRTLRALAVAGLVGGILCSTTLAQGAPAAAKEEPNTIMWFLGAIGWVGIVQLIQSIVVFAMVIEHFVNVKREKFAPPEVIEEIEVLFEEGNYQEALEFCEQHDVAFSRIVAAGIQKIGHSFEVIEKSVEEMEDEEAIKLGQKVGWLGVHAAIAPMLGLLGTVTGMVGAFDTIASAGETVKPADFADDISQALLTTVIGLVIAIPISAFYVYFKNRATKIGLEMGAICEELFDRFRAKQS
ncbi:MAG: MotA/TolQ/ExbB proton channel family protein [Planctomycetes bacterium]|nr:MotA/TolQ/ExbB proton channel family protein [Planctomycetota bacterium]